MPRSCNVEMRWLEAILLIGRTWASLLDMHRAGVRCFVRRGNPRIVQ